jgi:hypothetical protein
MSQTAFISKDPKTTNKTDAFWLVYSSDSPQALTDAFHALYYLPDNFKLIVLTDQRGEDARALMSHIPLLERVQFAEKSGVPKESSPLAFADAIISDTATTDSTKPLVLIADNTTTDLEDNDQQGYTVSAGNPAAMASAIFMISRAAV